MIAAFFILIAAGTIPAAPIPHEAVECSDRAQRLGNIRQLRDGTVDSWDLITCSPPRWIHHYNGAGLPAQGKPYTVADLTIFVAGGTISARPPPPAWTPYPPCLALFPGGTVWLPCPTMRPTAGQIPTRTPPPATRTQTPGAVTATPIPFDVVVVPAPCPAGWTLKPNGYCYRPAARTARGPGRIMGDEDAPSSTPTPTPAPVPRPPAESFYLVGWVVLAAVAGLALLFAHIQRRRSDVPRRGSHPDRRRPNS